MYGNFKEAHPDRFEQRVRLGDTIIFKHDLAGNDEFAGWNSVEYVFKADATDTTISAKIKVTRDAEKGWDWGDSARIGIGNVSITRTDAVVDTLRYESLKGKPRSEQSKMSFPSADPVKGVT